MRSDPGFTPYGWFSNRPDPESQDFKNVIAWLEARGVAAPKPSYILLDAGGFIHPGAVNPGPILMLTFQEYLNPMDATHVLNAPGEVLSLLNKVPTGTIPTYTPPEPPAEPEPLPPGQPANPIGVPWFKDWVDGKQCFQCVTGDTLPDKSLYPSANPEYIKVRLEGPFGLSSQYWKALR